MNFDNWADTQMLGELEREDFKNWLLYNGYSLTIYRRNEEWWQLWIRFTKDRVKK